jgi:hypothetical protein
MSETAQHKRPERRGTGRGRVRGGLLLGALVLTAVGASAAASAALGGSQAVAPTELEESLEAEIDALRDAGLPAEDPKVQMLQESLDQLRNPARPRPAPSVDVGALLAEERADRVDPAAAAAEAVAEGDPVPGLLSAAELTGATCVSVPQPDGTSRYLAIGADGVARTVLFGADGQVRRLPDTQVAGLAPGTAVTPTPEGDLQLAPPGQQPTVIDVT